LQKLPNKAILPMSMPKESSSIAAKDLSSLDSGLLSIDKLPNEAISSVDEASVLHDNNDQNMLTGDAGHPESSLRGEGPVDSISSKDAEQFYALGTVVPVSPEAEKPNEAIYSAAEAPVLRSDSADCK
jgi:hypothetical protein